MDEKLCENHGSLALTETGFDCVSYRADSISSCIEQPIHTPALQSVAADPDSAPSDCTVVLPVTYHIVTPTMDYPVTNQHAAHTAGCILEKATDHASVQGEEDSSCHRTDCEVEEETLIPVVGMSADVKFSSSDAQMTQDTQYGTADIPSHHISIDAEVYQEATADLTAVSLDNGQNSPVEADLTVVLSSCDQVNQHDANINLTETPNDYNLIQCNSDTDLTIPFNDNEKICQSTDIDGIDNTNARIPQSSYHITDEIRHSIGSGVTDDNIHVCQSASHSDVGNASGSQAPDTAGAPLLTGVRVKQEPVDAGYENSGQYMQRPLASCATRENIISSTVVRRGKRNVRVTVVRGEWRSPHASHSRRKSENPANVNIVTIPSQKTWEKTCTKSKTFERTKRKRSSKALGGMVADSNLHSETTIPQVGDFDTGIGAESQSSFPVAVYRNAYTKAEPADDTFTSSTNQNSCASSQTEMFSSGLGRSLVVIPSHVPVARGRGRGRGRRLHYEDNLIFSAPCHFKQISPGSSTTRPFQMGTMVRPCSVQLTQLPTDISETGTVNLRTDPQMSQRLGWWKSPMLQPGVRPHITVANPEAYHPVQRRNKSGPRPWSCKTCDKSFKTASALSQHKKIHLGVKEHVCHICQKAFTYKSALTAHSRTHSQERPFVCKLCGAGFRWNNHLTNHLATHSKVKPFSCDHCKKRFAQKANLQTHLKRHAGVKPFSCPECNATFLLKSYLIVHLRRHTGEKPYSCDQCTATFAHTTSLQAHLRSHNDERPFKCHLCSSAFRQQSHRRTHIRLIHSKPQKEDHRPKRRCATNANKKNVLKSNSISC